MSTVTLIHLKSPQVDNGEDEHENATGNSLNAPQRWWRDNPALTKPTPKSDDIDKDKHQGLTVTKNNTLDDDGTTQHPPRCGVWVLTPNDDASTEIACTMSQPPNMSSTLYESPIVQRRESAQIL